MATTITIQCGKPTLLLAVFALSALLALIGILAASNGGVWSKWDVADGVAEWSFGLTELQGTGGSISYAGRTFQGIVDDINLTHRRRLIAGGRLASACIGLAVISAFAAVAIAALAVLRKLPRTARFMPAACGAWVVLAAAGLVFWLSMCERTIHHAEGSLQDVEEDRFAWCFWLYAIMGLPFSLVAAGTGIAAVSAISSGDDAGGDKAGDDDDAGDDAGLYQAVGDADGDADAAAA